VSVIRSFILAHDVARQGVARFAVDAPAGTCVEFKEPTRNREQNALMWVWLQAFSEQLTWPINGDRVRMTPDEWKDVLTAAFRRESHRIAQGLDGGMVILGMRTSQMGKREFAEFLEFVMATAAARGVVVEELTA